MIVFLTTMLWADPLEHYVQGKQHAQEGRYEQSIESYLRALEERGADPHIYWGLGNALYQSGEELPAKIAWIRAQKMQPWNSDIAHNLSASDLPIEGPMVPAEYLSWLATVFFLGGLWGWQRRKDMSIVLFLSFFLFLWFSLRAMENDRIAYVVSQEVSVRSKPSVTGISLFLLQKGDDFRIIERRSNNYFIERENQKGWIGGENLLSLNPKDTFFIPEETK
ncbi:MAG: tetratricopeptide repeat protein [Myxococcota bacterium]|nr:tetratricopeptide repeat protein [Myxococcota bacterium]